MSGEAHTVLVLVWTGTTLTSGLDLGLEGQQGEAERLLTSLRTEKPWRGRAQVHGQQLLLARWWS